MNVSYKKNMRLNIHKLIFNFLDLLKKGLGFTWVMLSHPGLIMPIATLSSYGLRPDQGSRLSQSRVNLSNQARFHNYAFSTIIFFKKMNVVFFFNPWKTRILKKDFFVEIYLPIDFRKFNNDITLLTFLHFPKISLSTSEL
jgi:hypothetical protein